ncbi:Asp-tRNA(Asn)/Glu-tRNA(Gln) amidotransferase subunit GatB [Mycoplasma sp. SG1]|uniref:Asp-tRNA(Asn)/Glu-tRNA(Gln) amidotransferase subunit GatB n=1 Tax=Mycoplasma sp. SG1 TaxID=2810348 RepID=UPI002024FC82|nr:Asp-tRNA(Asn)/Glu-tRNA(Gln) amidotransferase subunit GatB [Mycoplasma sp. SG1]URM53020.1 Asp-tRNA(Asn)/Glu-tRNA(Gln) amidotransferase subunit GatB [Mycoplasma sp. SG1]
MAKLKEYSLKEILEIFEISIGLEIHVNVISKTKLFSPTPVVDFKSKPNVGVGYWELGYPGVKPLLNKEVVIKALQTCLLLNMDISKVLTFDRKNYFYPDLPKGYQLTQYYNPIGKNGYLNIFSSQGKLKKIRFIHLHIEEDSAKLLHKENRTLIDYNRAGNPLIEIVTDHIDLKTGDDVQIFLTTLHSLLVDHKITKGRLEGGEFRFDVNVSLKKKNALVYGQKVEIKNISSFNFAKKATINEIITIGNKCLNNIPIDAETKGFNPKTLNNFSMRKKTTLADYRYIPDCNILPIELDNNWIEEQTSKISIKPNYSEKINIIVNEWKFSKKDAIAIVNNPLLLNVLKKLQNHDRVLYYVFFSNLFITYLNQDQELIKNFSKINKFCFFLFNQRQKFEFIILKKIVKSFINQINEIEGDNFQEIVNQIVDTSKSSDDVIPELKQFVQELIQNNPQTIDDYLDPKRKDKVINNFYMRRTVPAFIKKLPNPKLIKEIVISVLDKRIKKD